MHLQQPLHHAVKQGEVAPHMRLHIGARDLGAEKERPRIARHGEVHGAGLDDRIDRHHLPAATADHHQRPHQPRMVAGGVTAEQEDHVGMFHVVELDGAGAATDHAREPHAAGLVAVEAAVVDMVRAVEPREELQQEARLVARSATEVEEALLGLRRPQLPGDSLHRVGPVDRPVVLRALLENHRLDEPAGVLHLIGREHPQLGQRVGLEEGRLHRPLHVGDHRLERLLADLGEVAGLIDHAAGLAAHADRAGLAGVFRPHRLPEGPHASRLAGLLEGVEHRPPAAACLDSAHGTLRGDTIPVIQPKSCRVNATRDRMRVASSVWPRIVRGPSDLAAGLRGVFINACSMDFDGGGDRHHRGDDHDGNGLGRGHERVSGW